MKKFSFFNNVLWTLFGSGFPLIISIYAIPKLITGYGDIRFGLITLIWSIIGYFSIFDFGLGRALTKLVSERLGTSKESELPDLIKTSVLLISILGVLAGVVLVLSSNYILNDFLHIDGDLLIESQKALKVLGLGLPLVVLQAGLIGLLEAHKAFKEISSVRLVLGVFNFLGPVLVLQWSNDLYLATAVLAFARIVSTSLYVFYCYQHKIFEIGKGKVQLKFVSSLFHFGAWITLSNIISPLMVQLDRFIIGSFISVATIAFYTVPADTINKMSVAPQALISVIFPVFASVWGTSRNTTGNELFVNTCKIMIYAVLPLLSFVILFTKEGLLLWLGKGFSDESTVIVQFLAIGFLFNSVARIPHALLQSVGRPDITAKLHLVELPIYLLALWLLLKGYGVRGAAIAWTIRMFVDLILLLIASAVILPEVKSSGIKIFKMVCFSIPFLIGLMFVSNLLVKIATISAVLIFFGFLFYKSIYLFQSSYNKIAH